MKVFVVFARSQLKQFPLATILVVIIDPVINLGDYILKGIAVENEVFDLVLHMTEEAFLWSVVPAVTASGHGLYEIGVMELLYEGIAGVMTALVAVDDGFIVKSAAVLRN